MWSTNGTAPCASWRAWIFQKTDKDKKRRLSDFMFLMPPLEQRLKELGKWIEHPTLTDVNQMFAQATASIQEFSANNQRSIEY